MAITSSDNNIFKYVHFKPARPTVEHVDNFMGDGEETPENPAPDHAGRQGSKTLPDKAAALLKAHDDLAALDPMQHLDPCSDSGNGRRVHRFGINPAGCANLKKSTRHLLQDLGIDLESTSHVELFSKINLALAETLGNQTAFDFTSQAEAQAGHIQAVGVAQLLVVKQQIKGYEAAEIAHVENVLSGESKIRTHSFSSRSEQSFSTTSENTLDRETELESTESFELNKETSRTFQKDTELSGELSLSGKYGPTVSFDSNFAAGQNRSESELDTDATNFAKETVERSKENILEKTVTERRSSIVKEVLERNEHTLSNDQPEHSSAVYQYLDKIYESQVFDYGKRQMFDFMIPEPSSYLWYLRQKSRLEINAQEPERLEDKGILTAADISKANYLSLAAAYGVSELPTPPSIFLTKRLQLDYGDGSTNDSGSHKMGMKGELDIPEGYRPYSVHVTLLATSDENLHFTVNVGDTIAHLGKDAFAVENVGSGSGNHKRYTLSSEPFLIFNSSNLSQNTESEKLYVNIYSWEAGNYTAHLEILFLSNNILPFAGFDIEFAWKQEVYTILLEAYQNALMQYKQDAAYEEANARARESEDFEFGSPPAVNRKLIQNELKKHCLALVRNEHLGSFQTSHTGEPPQFNLQQAREQGELVRFLENAFEWAQMQYVFYPYYWARPGDQGDAWFKRFSASNADYSMTEFLAAGYARVVVPVREGFDRAVLYFIEHGVPYNGLGEPEIGDPLYRSIIDEIKERSDAGQGEIPVGDSWETRLPTAAVVVQGAGQLPSWSKVAGTDWNWEPN